MPNYYKYFFSVLCFMIGMNIILPTEILNDVVSNFTLEQIQDFDADTENEDEREEREELNDDNVMNAFRQNLLSQFCVHSIISSSRNRFNTRIYLDIDTPPPLFEV